MSRPAATSHLFFLHVVTSLYACHLVHVEKLKDQIENESL